MALKAALSDDCFAKFDAAFDSLAAELAPPGTTRTTSAPASTLRIVPPPDSEARTPRVAAGYNQPLDEYGEAFDLLDAQLAARSASATAEDQALTAPPAHSESPAPPAETVSKPAARIETSLAATASPAQLAPASAVPAYEMELWKPRAEGGTPLERLMGTLQNLSLIQRRLNDRSARTAERLTLEDINDVFNDVRQLCVDFDLQTARVRADFALAALESDHLDVLSNEIGELVRHMRHDLQSCSIYPIARNRVWSFSLTLDELTSAAFPGAQAEIAEGGMCFGFGRHSASVFHMLRAAEYGTRALTRAVENKRKGEVAPAMTLTTLLEHRIAEAERWSDVSARDHALDFYWGALSEVRRLQGAERKLARGVLNEQQAIDVYHATRDLLVHLSTRVSQTQSHALKKSDF